MKNNLSKKLSENKASISELSRKTGISRTTLTDIVKCRKSNITFKKALLLSDFFKCSVGEIFPCMSKDNSLERGQNERIGIIEK